jgi:hypothetical protein
MLFSDQLNVISTQIWEITEEHQGGHATSNNKTPVPELIDQDNYDSDDEGYDDEDTDTSTTKHHQQPNKCATVKSLLASVYLPIIHSILDPDFDIEKTLHEPQPQPITTESNTQPIFIPQDTEQLPQKFTKKQIMNSPDYQEWKKSLYQ